MPDEQTTPTDTEGKETNKPVENTEKPVSIVEEAKAIRDEIRTEREKLDKANTEAKELAAGKMLSGETTSEPSKPKDETDKEYRDRVTKEMSEGKTEFGN